MTNANISCYWLIFRCNLTGKTIKVRIDCNCEEHIQYIGKNKVGIAYMGPASYVNMVKEYGNKPVLARLEVKGSITGLVRADDSDYENLRKITLETLDLH